MVPHMEAAIKVEYTQILLWYKLLKNGTQALVKYWQLSNFGAEHAV